MRGERLNGHKNLKSRIKAAEFNEIKRANPLKLALFIRKKEIILHLHSSYQKAGHNIVQKPSWPFLRLPLP